MGIKLNTKAARKKLKGADKYFDQAADDAVEEEIKAVFVETQVRVPKETGALAGTGDIKKNDAPKHHSSSSVWYGEPGEGEGIIDYAAAVHEILEAEHAPPTGPKFVEQPLIESIGDFKKITAEKMRRAVKEAF